MLKRTFTEEEELIVATANNAFVIFLEDVQNGTITFKRSPEDPEDLIYNMFVNAHAKGRLDEINFLKETLKEKGVFPE